MSWKVLSISAHKDVIGSREECVIIKWTSITYSLHSSSRLIGFDDEFGGLHGGDNVCKILGRTRAATLARVVDTWFRSIACSRSDKEEVCRASRNRSMKAADTLA